MNTIETVMAVRKPAAGYNFSRRNYIRAQENDTVSFSGKKEKPVKKPGLKEKLARIFVRFKKYEPEPGSTHYLTDSCRAKEYRYKLAKEVFDANADKQDVYITGEIYDRLRHPDVPYTGGTDISQMLAAEPDSTLSDDKKLYTLDSGDWNIRFSEYIETPYERIFINAFPDKELIEKLDEFVLQQDGSVLYKVPSKKEGWDNRHDSVIIYFPKETTPEIEKEITGITKKFIRPTKNEVLIGDKIAEGVYKDKNPSYVDKLALFSDLESISRSVSRYYERLFNANGDISTGMTEAAKLFIQLKQEQEAENIA